MFAPESRTSGRRQRGISIIELMVGIVVAMLVGIAATSTAVVFTASQRQGIGVGGVAVNANTAMAALKNDAATAGLGFFGNTRYLCATLNLSVDATANWDGTAFTPVRITRVSGMDRIDVLQAARVEAGASVLLKMNSDGTSAAVNSYLPAAVGDSVLVSQNDTSAPCLVRTVTAVAASTDDTPQTFTFAAGASHNSATFTTNPTYVGNGGSGSGAVTLLGTLRWNRYRLDGTNLILERPLEGGSAILARNVMALRAQYGTTVAAPSTAASKTLNSWDDATGTFAALSETTLPRVRAVRVGIVTRSPQREKPNAAGVCEASTAKPQLFGADVEPDVTDWACYRFRSSVLVIPLRNLVLGMK